MLAAHIPNPLPTSVLTKNLSWTHPAGRLIWAVVLLLIGLVTGTLGVLRARRLVAP